MKKEKIKVTVIGHFGIGEDLINGQTIKTKVLYKELCSIIGEENVHRVDTHGGLLKIIKTTINAIESLYNSKNVILLLAHRGIKILMPIMIFFNFIFKSKLHYSVIGGWIPAMLCRNRLLKYCVSKIDYVYVETNTMKEQLNELGLLNVMVVPNAKELDILDELELVYNNDFPLPICTFSRINRLKGIDDAVNAVNAINKINGQTIYELDIYGKVDEGEQEWFEKLSKTFPHYIRYKGFIDFSKTTTCLKNYYFLLFPTHYFTEGVPGTIIDAYSAGVPVLSSKWNSFQDLVIEGKTGYGYDFNNYESLLKEMDSFSKDFSKINDLKINCLNVAKRYKPEIAFATIINNLL